MDRYLRADRSKGIGHPHPHAVEIPQPPRNEAERRSRASAGLAAFIHRYTLDWHVPRVGDPIESQRLPGRNVGNGPTNSPNPGPFDRVEVSAKPPRITNNDGVGAETLGDEGVGRYYAIPANHEFALIAHD